ncbi:helix-turn-helix transcriptional regulator [Rhizobium sp. C4]|uniref:helix-turn-helix transcriptional regulator n=1 Tax=Rhizobium sp. C4 TaxID=1349800 RepID=UPI001E4984B8|nr:helix-turn-helix transcriptional regulator [Rhizobium sp. C4]MCD2176114.1 helix-turn-helix transcriptional regulator [Rhizobium sp. C4]
MLEEMEVQIVDRAYEAAVVPDLWPQLCDLVSAHVGAYSTALITLAPDGPPRWTASDCIAEQMKVYETSGVAQRSRRPLIGLERWPNMFMRDVDLLTPEELEDDPLRLELLEPIGLAWEMGGSFLEPSGSVFVYSQLNRTDNGPFSPHALMRMNKIKSDLARAGFLAARLGLKQAQSMTEGLEAIGLAGAVIGDNGQVITANRQFADLSPRIRTASRNRLFFEDVSARSAYESALELVQAGKTAPVQSIPIAAKSDDPALVIQIIPVRRAARDIFNRSCALVVVTPVVGVGPPDLRVICGLFDLTGAEAVVAQKLTAGFSVDEISAALRISKDTVRTHIKALFRKTGVNRQVQLVRLLAGLGPTVVQPKRT